MASISQYSWLFFKQLSNCLGLRTLNVYKHNPMTSNQYNSLLLGTSRSTLTTMSGDGTTTGRQYIPRRTLMYVPCHDRKKVQKIPNLGVDCAVLECEDGVAINMKEQARKNCKDALNELRVTNVDLAFRVNSVSSGLMEEDLDAVIGNGLGEPVVVDRLPQTILVPKIDTVEELTVFTEKLHSAKLGRTYTPYFIFFTESAQGLMNLRDILQKANVYCRNGHYILDGVVFGSDDFCADIGAERTTNARELIYARQKVVAMAKAYKLQAIDMVHVDIKDQVGLKAISEEGAKMGFTGKQVIHPSQVAVVENAFTPNPARIEWATELIHGFEEHEKKGQGAFVFRGHMIDMPLLRQAKNVLKIVSNVHRS